MACTPEQFKLPGSEQQWSFANKLRRTIAMKIRPLIHRCTVRGGSIAGNKLSREVTAIDVELAEKCEYCHERLATPEMLAIHIYEELTK